MATQVRNQLSPDQLEEEKIENFLNIVKGYKCIYDKSLPEYHDVDRENAFKNVAFLCVESPSNVKKMWENCLSKYRNEKKFQEQESRSGSGSSIRKQWPHYKIMNNFMQKVYKEDSILSNSGFSQKNKSRKKETKDLATTFAPVIGRIDASSNKISNAIDFVVQDLKNKNENLDEAGLIGKLIEARLNALPMKEAMKVMKDIMEIVNSVDDYDDFSEDDSDDFHI